MGRRDACCSLPCPAKFFSKCRYQTLSKCGSLSLLRDRNSLSASFLSIPSNLSFFTIFFFSGFTMQDPCSNPFPFSCVSLRVLNRRLSQFSYKCLSLTLLCPCAFGLSCDLHLGSLTGDWQMSVWCWSTALVTLSSAGQPVLTLDFDPWRLQLIALKPSPNKANICWAARSNLGTSWHLNIFNYTEVFSLFKNYHFQLASCKLFLLAWNSRTSLPAVFAKVLWVLYVVSSTVVNLYNRGFCFIFYFSRVLKKIGSHLRPFCNPLSLSFPGNILVSHFILKYVYDCTSHWLILVFNLNWL